MDAETEVTMKVILTMDEGEARWLKAQMQNSPCGDAENKSDKSRRQELFNTLDSKGVKG
jgi:hypothetical protein